MPGQRVDFAVRGEEYETLADSLLSRLAIPQRIPWSRDYGIDFNCILRIDGKRTVRPGDAFCVQTGGPGKLIEYGGVNENGSGRDYEINWLKGLNVPFFYGRVTWPPRLELYSMLPVWRILMQSDLPFRIECELQDSTPTKRIAQDPQGTQKQVSGGYGDFNEWVVDLGPPIIDVSFDQLRDDAFVTTARGILAKWVDAAWTTHSRYRSRVAVSEYIRAWATNDSSQDEHAQFMAWSVASGANVERLIQALAPAMLNLGASLQWQRDAGAYALLPTLTLLRERGYQSSLLNGLIEGLVKSQAAGLPPGPP